MEVTYKSGEVLNEKVWGKDVAGNNLYLMVGERMANSVMCLVFAKDETEVFGTWGFNPDFVLHTIVKIDRNSLPVQYGQRN